MREEARDDQAEPGATDAPASRPYRRARQDRGAGTRAKLVAAALDAFGRYGFDSASTREIARRADANLAAIVYHFGSKEALHRAVAEHVVDEIRKRMGPHLQTVAAAFADRPPDRAEARALLQSLLEAQIEMLLGEAEAEAWARFIVREQMEPSASFDVILSFIGGAHGRVRRLVGVLLDIDPDSSEASLRTFALMGQIMIFRVAQPIVLATLGRDAFGPDMRHAVRRIVTEHVDRILGTPEGSP